MTRKLEIRRFGLWDKMKAERAPVSFDLEITARCNNDCRHCYNNLPADDRAARAAELTCDEIIGLAGDAAGLGAVWCLITGGEPLLRDDFEEIYTGVKRAGLLVSIYTNACLVTPAHVELFRRYPPRDIEVSVYGTTQRTYEAVTRRRGSFAAFTRGLALLEAAGIGVRLKAAVMRSNLDEIDAISRFCRRRTKDYYRFDPLLRLRFDGDPARNAEIESERLSPEEIVTVEGGDAERVAALHEAHAQGRLIDPRLEHVDSDRLLRCNAGVDSFTIGPDGTFRLCTALWHPDTIYDLRAGSLREAWEEWVPHVRDMQGSASGFLEKCRHCSLGGICLWCPAHAALETGELDARVEYFCAVAHARAAALPAVGEPLPSGVADPDQADRAADAAPEA